MGSYGRGPTIFDLTRVANIMDFGADPTGNQSCTTPIIQAIYWLTTQQAVNGTVYVPPGTFACGNEPAFVRGQSHLISVPSNIRFVGEGPGVSIIQLRPSVNKTLFRNSDPSGGNSDISFHNLRLNGRRSVNTSGSWQGIDMFNVTDFHIENVEVDNWRGDGIAIDHCFRVGSEGRCELHDNGRNGLWIHFTNQGDWGAGLRCYDNCRIDTAGTADGVRLNNLSTDHTFLGLSAYDTSAFGGNPEDLVLTGKLQGYGLREGPNEMVDRNIILGGFLKENLSGHWLQDWGRSVAFIMDDTVLGHNNLGNA